MSAMATAARAAKAKAKPDDQALAVAALARRIQVVRGFKVMIDSDLAALYGVPTKVLNQAVKRNAVRFPADFLFELTDEEATTLRSQLVTSNASARGGRRTLPNSPNTAP